MKIFVAIPVYNGMLGIESVRALLSEQVIALGLGDEFSVTFLASDAGIAGARNALAQAFMDSDADRLVFLDADVTFDPGALVKLAHMPVDFVAGVYRYKQDTEAYPMHWVPGKDLWADKYGLIEVMKVPTGFLALSRNVFEKIRQAHPERTYRDHGVERFCYFQFPFVNGQFYGEDFFFCQEWTDLGGKVYVDPEIKLTHWQFQPQAFVGRLGDWLRAKMEGP